MKLFRSRKRAIRVRAAKVLLNRWRQVPLNVLLEILDDLASDGLGAGVERILLRREDPQLVEAMVSRLRSPAPFVGVACTRRKLKACGFEFDIQAEGSHEIWFNLTTKRYTTIPNHPGDMPEGTLRAILRQAGIDFLAA